MAVYQYKALNKQKQVVQGLVEANNEKAAADILVEKEYAIISLRVKSALGKGSFNLSFGRVKPKDMVIFSRQFSVLISAGVALVHSLHLLTEQTSNPKFKEIVAELAEEIDGGARLSDSLAKRPLVFSNFFVSVVRSGESSGKLDEVLNYLADELEKDYDLTSKIKGAMIYPAFVLTGLSAVGVIMMVFVVPKLTDVMQESGGELPFATRVIIAVSHFMTDFWWLLIILIAGAVIGARFFMKLPAGKHLIDSALLRLPIFGKLFQRIYLVRFTRSLETLLVGGVNISKGLQIAAEIVSNSVYEKLILETKKEVEDGNSISHVFSQSKQVPVMVSQMMSIGEKTGRLDVILRRITDFYTREINNIVANLMTLMEPLIMVVLGVGVGMMVAAIIMPMYNMASQF